FEKRIELAQPLSDFLFQTLSKQSDINTMEGRARLATQALTYIKQLETGIFQTMLIEELSKRTRLSRDELNQQIKKPLTQPNHSLTPTVSKNKLPAPLRLASALLIQRPSLVHQLPESIILMDIPEYKFLADLIRIIKNKPEITTGALL